MADMRLIVAGAGGRMGRALTRVISETPGAVITGARLQTPAVRARLDAFNRGEAPWKS